MATLLGGYSTESPTIFIPKLRVFMLRLPSELEREPKASIRPPIA
jgi:hypothetical protein